MTNQWRKRNFNKWMRMGFQEGSCLRTIVHSHVKSASDPACVLFEGACNITHCCHTCRMAEPRTFIASLLVCLPTLSLTGLWCKKDFASSSENAPLPLPLPLKSCCVQALAKREMRYAFHWATSMFWSCVEEVRTRGSSS